jgi:hypothetical protein
VRGEVGIQAQLEFWVGGNFHELISHRVCG